MEKSFVLHCFTSTPNLSPFDVNMAMDAGWDAVVPYTSLKTGDIRGLVQDAIFSRSPSGLKRTGIFIGGRDMQTALQMLDEARRAMAPPFEISVFADPSGAFTTAAGMIARVGAQLGRARDSGWNGARVMVLGGTGPVGMASAILAAGLGAQVAIMSRKVERAKQAAESCRALCAEEAGAIAGGGQDDKAGWLGETDVVLATAAAGIEVLSADELAAAARLKVVADVNAVPPSGVSGLEAQHQGEALAASPSDAVGVGALAIGNVKYQVQHQLLKQMREAGRPVYLHYESACRLACEYIAAHE